MNKTTTMYVHQAFLYIFLLSMHNYNKKWPNFKFIWERVYFSATFSWTSALSDHKVPITRELLLSEFVVIGCFKRKITDS